jgi:hypothetical protein
MKDTDWTFSSNTIRLSLREWGCVVLICVISFLLIPVAWSGMEQYEPGADYRLPYRISDDYWMFERWSEHSSAKYPFLVLGDSVVWGQYVKSEHTLTHFLNEQAGKEVFANLGVDGIHPMAMAGLIRYYGKDIKNKAVLLHLNPLWMSSKKHDLQTDEEFRFNHPRLVPQVYPDLACYNPTFPEIVDIGAERYVPFFTWIRHMKAVYFENMAIHDWTMQYPCNNPLSAINFKAPAPKNEPKSSPVSWRERGILEQEFPWIRPESSRQYAAFIEVMELLAAQGNSIFVLIGPMNTHILTKDSRARYNEIKSDIERRLEEDGISFLSAHDLRSEYYADASHPLNDGYSRIARELLASNVFRKWIKKSNGDKK